MKVYKANNEFIEILLKNGFIETTRERKKDKNKRAFKVSPNGRKEISLEDGKIFVSQSKRLQDSKDSLTEKELKLLFLYFNLHPKDYALIDNEERFNFKRIEERLEAIMHEVNVLKKIKLRENLIVRFKRIIETYENISF